MAAAVAGADRGTGDAGAVQERVTLCGVLEGDLELGIPELGCQRVGTDEWFVLSDCAVKTEITGIEEARGLAVEMPVNALLVGRGPGFGKRSGFGKRRSCLDCSLRDVAYFVRGRCVGRVRRLLEELTEWRAAGPGDYWLLESRLAEWIALVLDQPEFGEKECCCSRDESCDIAAIEAVAGALRENLGETPTIRDLARRHFINECKLKALFRRHFGVTIHGYLREQRMRHARRLLEGKPCGVLAAAQEVGYTNASHFARAFREVHGVNPQVVSRRRATGVAAGKPTRLAGGSPFGVEAEVEGTGLSWSI
jgi:AraC-like DNA-binding protein